MYLRETATIEDRRRSCWNGRTMSAILLSAQWQNVTWWPRRT